MNCFRCTHLLLFCSALFALAGNAFAATKPITFEFAPLDDATAIPSPHSRELWAEVSLPSGKALILPAYYAGDGSFAVHVRPDEIGVYRFGEVSEITGGKPSIAVKFRLITPREVANEAQLRLPFIQRDPRRSAAFLGSDGKPFVPVGANLAWAVGDCVPYYRAAISAFAKADLNWMRVWMVHWSQLNLDWLPEGLGRSPKPGDIDPRIAANWDQLLEAAEEQDVYVQLVLQHHGQFTTGTNSSWKENPWNITNPDGFLRTPTEFFTSADARRMTKLKYRYIVARWGWSPAVFAWEFFNEVHWVDAIDKEKNEAVVAAWHNEMAGFLRSVDVYRHLITTSTENLRSPIYEQMDFYQPHLYAANMVAGARSFASSIGNLGRPVFYGEIGDDHLPVSDAIKNAGLTIIPPVWASLMGEGPLPAQPWEGWKLIELNRLGELGAVHRFLDAAQVSNQPELRAFSAVVDSPTRVPLRLAAGQMWQRRTAPDFAYPLDGREPIEAANIPGILVGSAGSLADGFPDRITYQLDLPHKITARIPVTEVGAGGAALRVSVDGRIVAEQSWPRAQAHLLPTELTFSLAVGSHTLLIENSGGADWIKITGVDLGLDTSVLAAIGRRNDRFITAWLWHRTNLYALEPLVPTGGTLVLADVPAGSWKVTWWDTTKGEPATSTLVKHEGGQLKLATPSINRHAAVVLTR